MKLFTSRQILHIFSNLPLAILMLLAISLAGVLGSVVEQSQPLYYYQENYPTSKTFQTFLTWPLIINLGIDHVFETWWFFALMYALAACLASCTTYRQLPNFLGSKEPLWRSGNSFWSLPLFTQNKKVFYVKEIILTKLHLLKFYAYQKKGAHYSHKGLIGRVSPMLVHLSLLVILSGSAMGTLKNFKAPFLVPKGELLHAQPGQAQGYLSIFEREALRVNDFWGEYEQGQIRQFYSNLSSFNEYGKEVREQTISVNHPLRSKKITFYQNDWNASGIRFQKRPQKHMQELPALSLKKEAKVAATLLRTFDKMYLLVFSKLQNIFLVYNNTGCFLSKTHSNGNLSLSLFINEALTATGLLTQTDPSMQTLYCGFGILMLTTCLSCLPYTQFSVLAKKKERNVLYGCITNRGKNQLEIQNESLLRFVESFYNIKVKSG